MGIKSVISGGKKKKEANQNWPHGSQFSHPPNQTRFDDKIEEDKSDTRQHD